MKAYWISLYLKVDNQENLKKYAQTVTPIIKSYGGLPLVRGGKHTTFDGDLMFAISTGEKQLKENFNDILAINQAASLCVSRSIARGVYHASNSKSDIFPSFKNKFKIKVS